MKSFYNEIELFKICSTGNINHVKETFMNLSKTEIEAIKDTQDASCLHYAARYGHVKTLEYFIFQKNISPFLVSKVGATILHDAAVKGQVKVIDWILKNTDLNLTLKDNDGATIVHLASKFDQLELIESILENHGNKSFKEQTYNGATCLHFACATNSFKTLIRLVKAVPNLVNAQMMNGVTPFYLAVQENNFPIAKFLSKSGANVHVKAMDGMNPLHVACQNGNLTIARYLLEEYETNINEHDFNGSTPLHFACLQNSVPLVSFLLMKEAKIIIDKAGNSALHDCATNGNIEIARLLISKNFDVSLKNKRNMNCVDIAKANGHREFSNEFEKFLIKGKPSIVKIHIKENVEAKVANEKSLKVENLKVEDSNISALSPLNSLMSLKSVSTSTPQDFITIVSECNHQPLSGQENANQAKFQSNKLNRNQSLIRIVSNNDRNHAINKQTENTPQTIIQSSEKKNMKRSESIQSATLAELNNCIAQFEKFSYFTEECFNSDKEIKFNEISNKLNEIKNTLIETKNNHLNRSFNSLNISQTDENNTVQTSILSNVHLVQPKESKELLKQNETEKNNLKREESESKVSVIPPPPPPPPVLGLFDSNQSNNRSTLTKKSNKPIDENGTLKSDSVSSNASNTLRTSSSSSSFMTELQTKLSSTKSTLRKTTSAIKLSNFNKADTNNNNIKDLNLNLTAAQERTEETQPIKERVSPTITNSIECIKRTAMFKQRYEMPEWKKKLIEKKRQSNGMW